MCNYGLPTGTGAQVQPAGALEDTKGADPKLRFLYPV